MLSVRRLLVGVLSLSTAGFLVSPAAANQPPLRPATQPVERSLQPEGFPSVFARDTLARPAALERTQSIRPTLPFQSFTPGIEPTTAFGSSRFGWSPFGGISPFGPLGSPIDGPLSSVGCSGWNSSFAPDILQLDANGDPYTRACMNPMMRMLQNIDAPPALVPGHNPDALYGPGFHPANIVE